MSNEQKFEHLPGSLAVRVDPLQTLSDPLSFHHDAWGHLVLTDGTGQTYVDVAPVRLFPISDSKRWVSIGSSAGHELVCIEDPSALSSASYRALEDELGRREFAPTIDRILFVSSNTEPSEWTVETDRGRTKFILKTEDDIRRLGEYSVLIFDAHGIRYLIPDERNLDAYSKRVVEWYV